MTSSPLVAVVVWAALAIWIGQLAAPWLGVLRSSLTERVAIGLVLLHAWMMLLDAAQIPWNRSTLLAPAVLALLAQWRWVGVGGSRHPAARGQIREAAGVLAVADLVAALAVAAFAYASWTLRSLAPDFIYHWGLKARHFAAEGGVEWSLLQGHDASYLHPDYPLMVPNLYAATELLSGVWSEPALMVWSVLFFGLLVWEGRGAADDVVGGAPGRLASATAALVLAGFSIGHLQAGAADLPFALAVLALARQLWRLGNRMNRPEMDAQQVLARIGVWSAFAVVCKIEGFPLAALAVGLAWLRCEWMGRSPVAALRRLPGWLGRHWMVWAPTALLGGWWLATMWSKGLYQATNSGWPTWERVQLTAEALPTALGVPTWTGLAWLLPLLPLGLSVPRLRWFVLLPCLQVGFYLSSYIGGAQSTTFWVVSSFPRLAFHVMPVVWMGIWAMVAWPFASAEDEATKARAA